MVSPSALPVPPGAGTVPCCVPCVHQNVCFGPEPAQFGVRWRAARCRYTLQRGTCGWRLKSPHAHTSECPVSVVAPILAGSEGLLSCKTCCSCSHCSRTHMPCSLFSSQRPGLDVFATAVFCCLSLPSVCLHGVVLQPMSWRLSACSSRSCCHCCKCIRPAGTWEEGPAVYGSTGLTAAPSAAAVDRQSP